MVPRCHSIQENDCQWHIMTKLLSINVIVCLSVCNCFPVSLSVSPLCLSSFSLSDSLSLFLSLYQTLLLKSITLLISFFFSLSVKNNIRLCLSQNSLPNIIWTLKGNNQRSSEIKGSIFKSDKLIHIRSAGSVSA